MLHLLLLLFYLVSGVPPVCCPFHWWTMMMTGNIRLFLLILNVWETVVGHRNGAPCQSQFTMHPSSIYHGESRNLKTSPPPYRFSVSDLDDLDVRTYTPGRVYAIRLISLDGAHFRGILVQPRVATRDGILIGNLRAGQFVYDRRDFDDYGIQYQQCSPFNNDSITHKNGTLKFFLDTKWTVDKNYGPIQFALSIVQDQQDYWELWKPESGLLFPDDLPTTQIFSSSNINKPNRSHDQQDQTRVLTQKLEEHRAKKPIGLDGFVAHDVGDKVDSAFPSSNNANVSSFHRLTGRSDSNEDSGGDGKTSPRRTPVHDKESGEEAATMIAPALPKSSVIRNQKSEESEEEGEPDDEAYLEAHESRLGDGTKTPFRIPLSSLVRLHELFQQGQSQHGKKRHSGKTVTFPIPPHFEMQETVTNSDTVEWSETNDTTSARTTRETIPTSHFTEPSTTSGPSSIYITISQFFNSTEEQLALSLLQNATEDLTSNKFEEAFENATTTTSANATSQAPPFSSPVNTVATGSQSEQPQWNSSVPYEYTSSPVKISTEGSTQWDSNPSWSAPAEETQIQQNATVQTVSSPFPIDSQRVLSTSQSNSPLATPPATLSVKTFYTVPFPTEQPSPTDQSQYAQTNSTITALYTANSPAEQPSLTNQSITTLYTANSPAEQPSLTNQSITTLYTANSPAEQPSLTNQSITTLYTANSPAEQPSLTNQSITTLYTANSPAEQPSLTNQSITTLYTANSPAEQPSLTNQSITTLYTVPAPASISNSRPIAPVTTANITENESSALINLIQFPTLPPFPNATESQLTSVRPSDDKDTISVLPDKPGDKVQPVFRVLKAAAVLLSGDEKESEKEKTETVPKRSTGRVRPTVSTGPTSAPDSVFESDETIDTDDKEQTTTRKTIKTKTPKFSSNDRLPPAASVFSEEEEEEEEDTSTTNGPERQAGTSVTVPQRRLTGRVEEDGEDRDDAAYLQDDDYCSSSPCVSTATCINMASEGRYQCKCEEGWTGPACDVRDYCGKRNQCKNGGRCVNGKSGYTCNCSKHYVGKHCQNKCPPSLCRNGGTCSLVEKGGYVCLCRPGYTGIQCEIDIDDCANNPCQYGGTCFDRVNGFDCHCNDGYMGDRCHRPCQNIYKSCELWRRDGKCESTRHGTRWFDKNCAVTCGRCLYNNRTVRTEIPLPPVLEPLGFLIGKWNINSSHLHRFPVDFSNGNSGYYEEIEFIPTRVPMFGTPSINFTAISRNNQYPADVMVSRGFMTLKTDSARVYVSLMTTGNDGVTVIEEGALIDAVTLEMKVEQIVVLPDVQLKMPTMAKRQLALISGYLRETVERKTGRGPVKYFAKYFYKDAYYPVY